MLTTDFTNPDLVSTSPPAAETRYSTSGAGDVVVPSELNSFEKRLKQISENLITDTGATNQVQFAFNQDGAKKISELTSDAEYTALQEQHRQLVNKRFESGLSKDETLQLGLVRWMLDCVEVSRSGAEDIDPMEQIVKAQEIMAAKVTQTVEKLEAILDAESAKNRYKKSA